MTFILFPVICWYGWQGWKWIETWKSWLSFSTFDATLTKKTKKFIMGCYILKTFHKIQYSPHSLSGTFCAEVKPLTILAKNWAKTTKSSWHSPFKLQSNNTNSHQFSGFLPVNLPTPQKKKKIKALCAPFKIPWLLPWPTV